VPINQSLEDFASGVGPGAYSAQQGSTVPIGATGGLPLGSAPMQPPRAPAPTPTFQAQRSPLLQLGGQAPDLNQMIAQRLQSIAAFNPATAKDKDEDAYGYAMYELPKLQSLAATRSQDKQLQQNYLKELSGKADEFHTKYTPEQQAAMRPFMTAYLRNTAKLAGIDDLDDDTINQTLTSPSLAGGYSALFNDATYSEQERQQAMQLIAQGKDVKTREEVVALVQKRKDAELTSLVQQHLPAVLQRLGASPAKPLDGQTFMTSLEKDAEIGPMLKSSPALRRNLNTFVTDKNNADVLASWGLKPGSVDTKKMAGPELGADVREMLATLKGPDGKPLVPANATTEHIQWATKAAQAFKVETASKQGLSVELYKRTLPAPGDELAKYVDINALVTSGELVKPKPGTTVADLYGNQNLRYATDKQQEAVGALEPARQQLASFQTISDRLIKAKTPFDAAAQGIKLFAGAYSGANPEAKAYLDTSMGFIGTLARAYGGQTGVLTDADVVRMKSAVIASFFDTEASKDVKKAIVNDIYKASHKAAIGGIAGTQSVGQSKSELETLLKKLDDSTAQSFKSSLRADQKAARHKKTGEVRIGNKTDKLPEGWEEIK
jgi:hypothetical protein